MSLKQKVKGFLKCRYRYYSVIKPRLAFGKRDLDRKLETMTVNHISDVQKKKIADFWSRYPVKPDYRWYDVYNTLDPMCTHLEHYMPHDIYYAYVDTYFSNVSKATSYDDKNMYDIYFPDIAQPRTIARVHGGIILDGKYNIISIDDLISMVYAEREVIIKPSIGAEGGEGIVFWNISENTREELMEIVNSRPHLLISQIVKQHDTLNKIHKNSINTIRIMTMIIDGEVKILSSILRMGVGGARVDNASSGGIFCGIALNGELKSKAYDVKGNVYSSHPQGGELSKYTVPNFDKCIELVKSQAPRLVNVTRLCSWDLAVGEDGMPILIEANMTYGGINLHQLCNGPILGNMTPDILNMVFNK